jgi:transposase
MVWNLLWLFDWRQTTRFLPCPFPILQPQGTHLPDEPKKRLLRRKVKQVPDKANIATQEHFRSETLEPLVDDAQQGKIELLFMDAAHFVLLLFLGYLYSLATRFIKSWSGRKRFSVLGAINAVSKELVRMTEVAYVDSMTVCALLKELALRYYDRHIVLVLDNARYQRCRLVLQAAERLHIQLVFLPPYSPNRNLIERLWKFVKRKALYNQFYGDFPWFCAAIMSCLKKTHTEYRDALETLLRPNFQSFKDVTFNTFSLE